MKLSCPECIESVIGVSGSDRSLLASKDRGGLIHPSDPVFRCCKCAEAMVRQHVKTDGLKKDSYRRMLTDSLNAILNNKLNHSFACSAHATSLIRDIIKRYLRIRLRHEANTATLDASTQIRSKLNRAVIFAHV